MELRSEQAGRVQPRKDDRVEGGRIRNASSFASAICGGGKASASAVPTCRPELDQGYWFILAMLLKQFDGKNSGILRAPDNADARE